MSQLDQKLLWAELDEEQSGAATWHSIGNAWSRVVALSKAATYFISFPSDTTSATDDTAWRCMNEATFLFNGTRSLSISLSSLLLSWFLVCAGGVSQSQTEADPTAPIDSRAALFWNELGFGVYHSSAWEELIQHLERDYLFRTLRKRFGFDTCGGLDGIDYSKQDWWLI